MILVIISIVVVVIAFLVHTHRNEQFTDIFRPDYSQNYLKEMCALRRNSEDVSNCGSIIGIAPRPQLENDPVDFNDF